MERWNRASVARETAHQSTAKILQLVDFDQLILISIGVFHIDEGLPIGFPKLGFPPPPNLQAIAGQFSGCGKTQTELGQEMERPKEDREGA